ncbi:uncharacterized protein LOC124140522 isoform X1 [Haliotis rufescens]|uniref:uncharacterized protein LOC124140522 isoform X1 n=1 Tax=Haliotis rufescens TaxID=6454 RepID=UPI00201ED8C1|nr:uncharacterized protein LOC124140522 isoform X1 [Haliotis rufescens]
MNSLSRSLAVCSLIRCRDPSVCMHNTQESDDETGMSWHCSTCKKVVGLYKKSQKKVPNLFDVHIDIRDLKGKLKKHQEQRKTKLREIEIKVSALRNTAGGIIILHVSGTACGDRFLGCVDEFLEKSLNNFICDGTLFVDTYKRKWLCEISTFEKFTDCILISVEKTKGVATVDFKTKVCSDLQVERPSTLNIVSLLSHRKASSEKAAELRGLQSTPHKSRNIQLKAYRPEKKDKSAIESHPDTFAKYIWEKLRFREYLSCMTNNDEGGSFYLGIAVTKREYKTSTDGPRTSNSWVPNIEGFELKCGKRELENSLKCLIKSHVTKLDSDKSFGDISSDLVKFHFYPVKTESSRCVLEIAVGYTEGIVFYHKQGPLAYHITENGDVERITREDWLCKVTEIY